MNCNYCQGVCKKKGFYKSTQKYQCSHCNKYQRGCYRNRKYTEEKDDEIVLLNREAVGISSISRILSIPKAYPMLTPYQFASNDPIESIDLDGMERMDFRLVKTSSGVPYLQSISDGPAQVKVEKWPFTLNVDIPFHVRVEYNGEHYIFAPGGREGKYVESLPGQIGHTKYWAHDHTVNTMDGFRNFSDNPDAYTEKFISEEEWPAWFDKVDQKTQERLTIIEGAVSAAAGVGMAVVMSKRGFGNTNQIKPSLSINVKLADRTIIVDENLSPQIALRLQSLGYNVKTFKSGTLDADIITYADKTNAIVLTNNLKDFNKWGITTMKVSENMKAGSQVSTVVSAIENVNNKALQDPSIIAPGRNVSLAENKQ